VHRKWPGHLAAALTAGTRDCVLLKDTLFSLLVNDRREMAEELNCSGKKVFTARNSSKKIKKQPKNLRLRDNL